MAEKGKTPTKKKSAGASKKHHPPKNPPARETAKTDWPEDKALPLPLAIRGFRQIVGRYCGKYPDRGLSATLEEGIVYTRQIGQGQKALTAGTGA